MHNTNNTNNTNNIKNTLRKCGWTEDQINAVNFDPEVVFGCNILKASDFRLLNSIEAVEGKVVLSCGVTICSSIMSDGYPIFYIEGRMQSTAVEGARDLEPYLERHLAR